MLYEVITTDTTVSLFLSIMKITMVAPGRQHARCHLLDLCPQLLHAHDIRVLPLHPLEKTLARGGAYAVEVNRNDAHDQF